jgi:hypothetical protein
MKRGYCLTMSTRRFFAHSIFFMPQLTPSGRSW